MNVFTHYASLVDRGLETREYCIAEARTLGHENAEQRLDTALRRRHAAVMANIGRRVQIDAGKEAARYDHEHGVFSAYRENGSKAFKNAYWRMRDKLDT